MHFWYDTREGIKKKYHINGWIFPCIVCGIPTARYIIMKKQVHRLKIYSSDIDIQCCSKFCKTNINLSIMLSCFMVRYIDDTRSNR